MTSHATEVRRRVAAHWQAEDDWLEAVAILEEQRRRAEAAAAYASDRLRAAEELCRGGRRDPYALGLLDAAHLHLGRAREEAARLRDAEARCAALRERADRARTEVARLLGSAPPAFCDRGGPEVLVFSDRPEPVEGRTPARTLRCA